MNYDIAPLNPGVLERTGFCVDSNRTQFIHRAWNEALRRAWNEELPRATVADKEVYVFEVRRQHLLLHNWYFRSF